MLPKHIVVLWVFVLLLIPSPGRSEDKPVRAADVPREFKGVFEWRGEKKPYTLILKIDKIEETDAVVSFSGTHLYTPGDYEMKIEGTIDTQKRSVTIRESDPSRPDSVTDGSFEGTISGDLQTLEAVWTTRGTGNKGDLRVMAKKDK